MHINSVRIFSFFSRVLNFEAKVFYEIQKQCFKIFVMKKHWEQSGFLPSSSCSSQHALLFVSVTLCFAKMVTFLMESRACSAVGSFKKFARLKVPLFDPSPPLVCSCLFYMYPPPQRTFALVSYPHSSQKSSLTLMTLILNKKPGGWEWGVKREKRINIFVNSTYKINVFYTVIYKIIQ